MHTTMEANPRVRTAGHVRPLVEEDLSKVVDLYVKVFPQGRQYSRDRLLNRFNEVLLQNPWYDPSIPSLVFEKDRGVLGFLGIVVRPMRLGAKVIRVAASNHFMVDPDSRLTLAGLELLRAYLAGPQDLSIAEAGHSTRKLWEALGGRTSMGFSLHWTRMLRPARYTLYQLKKRGLPSVISWISKPMCSVIDGVAAHMSRSPLYQGQPTPSELLSKKDLLVCLSRCTKPNALRPHYDDHSLEWLLSVLSEKRMLGKLRQREVRNSNRESIGWYIYYSLPEGVSSVIQIGAARGNFSEVFQSLCYDAWHEGTIALTGRLEPRFTKNLFDNHCLLHWRSWMLVHSKDANVLDALERQEAFFTPLEGEFWISIEGENTDEILS